MIQMGIASMKKINNMKVKTIEDLEKQVTLELNSLKKLPETEKLEKIKDSEKMINHYVSMTNEMENRRIKTYELSLTILAISLTAIGLLLAQRENISNIFFWMIIGGLSIQILSSMLLLFFYYKQTEYPFPFKRNKKFGNSWKWFYYGNPEISKMSTNPIFHDINDSTKHYLNGLKIFLKQYKDEDINTKLENNLKQLYLLMTHNYYKNRFFTQLIKIRNLGFIVTFIVMLLIFIIIFFIENDAYIFYFFINYIVKKFFYLNDFLNYRLIYYLLNSI